MQPIKSSDPSTPVDKLISTSKEFVGKSKNVIYISQISLIFIVVIACIVNLSLTEANQPLWASLLSGCLGYILPTPKPKTLGEGKKFNSMINEQPSEGLLRDTSEQQLSGLLSR